MRESVVEKGFFIRQGRKRINPVFLAAFTVLTLAGCSSPSEKNYVLAPPPPPFDPYAPQHESLGPPVPAMMAFANSGLPLPPEIAIGNGTGFAEDGFVSPGEGRALKTSEKEKACSVKDRFDRNALLAYQWGPNRLAVDVDGIGWTSTEIEQIKVEYRLKLQDIKTRKEKCRYESHWQGMVGSGYNEFFLRENDTVFERLRKLRSDVEDGVNKMF